MLRGPQRLGRLTRKEVRLARQLGQLEAVVMTRLWSADQPVSVRHVLEYLRQDRNLAYTTVMTVLENLRRKGMVNRTKDGRAYRYWPAVTREQHAAALMEQVLATTEDRWATLLCFVEQIPRQDLEQLRDALNSTPQHRMSR